jgi:hypothetical protein
MAMIMEDVALVWNLKTEVTWWLVRRRRQRQHVVASAQQNQSWTAIIDI